MNNEIIVYYHDLCMDGFAAAAIMYQYTRLQTFIPVNYRAMPDLENEEPVHIVFVDFTPPFEWVEKNAARIRSIVILDHHADKKEECDKIQKFFGATVVYFDTELSGAGLAWKYVNSTPMPEVIRLINNRDLWIAEESERNYHELFVQYLKKGDKDEIFPPFIELFKYSKEQVEEILRPQAELLVKGRDKNIAFHLNKAVIIEEAAESPFSVAYISAPYYYASEAASTIMAQDDKVNLVVNVTLNRNGLGLSFRSRKGTGLAQQAAVRFNGGGHAEAAGGVFDNPVPFTVLHEMIFRTDPHEAYLNFLLDQYSELGTNNKG